MLFNEEIKAGVESLLFITNTPLKIDEIANIVCVSNDEVKGIIDSLIEDYASEFKGICVTKTAGGYIMATKGRYKEYVEKLYKPQVNNLSNAALETLAIVAYKQPVTRGEMELLRGVKVDGSVQRLIARGLIEEVGRKDTPGRPIMYGTTKQFLQHFGLNGVDDLPKMDLTDEAFKKIAMFEDNEDIEEIENIVEDDNVSEDVVEDSDNAAE